MHGKQPGIVINVGPWERCFLSLPVWNGDWEQIFLEMGAAFLCTRACNLESVGILVQLNQINADQSISGILKEENW